MTGRSGGTGPEPDPCVNDYVTILQKPNVYNLTTSRFLQIFIGYLECNLLVLRYYFFTPWLYHSSLVRMKEKKKVSTFNR